MDHIEVMRRAIEFKNPEYVPLEIIDVPGIYDDFGRLDKNKVKLLEGTEDFDSLQVIFSYVYRDLDIDEKGNRYRKDEWGCTQMIPYDEKYSYLVVKHPLADWADLKKYQFPSPSITGKYFSQVKKELQRYPDRFKVGYFDPGPFELASYILGFENLLISVKTNIKKVEYVFDGIISYYMALAKNWKEVGAHMIFIYDILAHEQNLLISPSLWRKHLKPFYEKFFHYVHSLGMYTGLGLDGKIVEILPDFKDAEMDVLDYRQSTLIGIDNLARVCNGKLCIKGSIDMDGTLVKGTPKEIWHEAKQLVKILGSRNGGFIALAYRWPVLKVPEENVKASVQAFNYFRKNHKRLHLQNY